MPRKKYQPRTGSRLIGDARRFSVRSARRQYVDQGKYVSAMARYAIAQAEADAKRQRDNDGYTSSQDAK